MGIASSLAILGNSLGPLAGGFVAERFGLVSVFSVNSVIFLLIALTAWRSDIDRDGLTTATPDLTAPIDRDADGPT